MNRNGAFYMEFGCLARYFNNYRDEVQFAQVNGFDFMQIWYDKKGLNLKPLEQLLPVILDEGFPSIIHAVLDINEIPEHISILKEILIKLGHKQLIIHPVCKSEPITDKTIYKLVCNMQKVVEQFNPCGITVYIENNSKLDPIFTSPEELRIMFSCIPELEFLLDVAHMENIEHLNELVKVKMPKILHVADRRLEEIHEHLPIGKGNIDFREVFNNVLHGFEGKIVFEIIQSNEDMIAAKNYFEDLLCFNREVLDKDIELALIEIGDYSTIVQWNEGRDADFLYQWAGPGYDFPITETKIEQRISNGANSAGADTYIYKIVSRSTNEMIGTIELFRINKEMNTATIGRFLINEQLRGKGLGKYALKLLVDKGFKEFDLKEINLRVFDFNEGAIKCYEKVGFVKSSFKENIRQTDQGFWGVYEMKIKRSW
jgi:RimJ/RimL family protein N-acetyltransferase/sugar phosphate isomerase/epimerase